ncbi:hypothetical protein [Morganella morganii]|uniref:hypothetical protein n=1 Tax=Morganella morganii TaxID=582 RepID=UPI00046AB513|nr:hypothetical protein [Morganella morganii]
MYKKFFKPLELNNIPFNFSLTFSVDGKDTLCIYNDRVFALKSYGYIISGEEGTMMEKGFFPNFSRLFFEPKADDNLNYIDSRNTYEDLIQDGARKSRIYFSWEGVCDPQGIKLMKEKFFNNEKVIYFDFIKWLNVQRIISTKERDSLHNHGDILVEDLYDVNDRIERDLEERISILVYQGVKRTNYFKSKIKKFRLSIFTLTFIYIMVISYTVFYKLL